MKSFITYITVISFYISTTHAQSLPPSVGSDKEVVPTGSEYIFKNLPDETLLTVQVLGGIKKPGIYHIPQGTDVVTLLSLTGGVFDNANLEEVILRKNKQKTISYLDLNNVISEIDTKPAQLDHGDVVFVDLKKPLIDTNTVTLITVTSIILGSILTAITIRDRQ